MLNASILLFQLCLPGKAINKTNTWTQHDEKYYTVKAEEICIKATKGILPCVKKFTKVRFQSYTWICAADGRSE